MNIYVQIIWFLKYTYMFVHVMYFWYFICIFYFLQDQLSATGLFEEAFALAESLARTADPYSNRIESSLYGGSHRCAGCENMHMMPCSRIHSTFWHPTLSQYIRLSHTLYTPVVTALHFHGRSDALHTHNTSAFLTPYTRLWSQPIPVDFLTLYTHTIHPTFSHPTHACGHSLFLCSFWRSAHTQYNPHSHTLHTPVVTASHFRVFTKIAMTR